LLLPTAELETLSVVRVGPTSEMSAKAFRTCLFEMIELVILMTVPVVVVVLTENQGQAAAADTEVGRGVRRGVARDGAVVDVERSVRRVQADAAAARKAATWALLAMVLLIMVPLVAPLIPTPPPTPLRLMATAVVAGMVLLSIRKVRRHVDAAALADWVTLPEIVELRTVKLPPLSEMPRLRVDESSPWMTLPETVELSTNRGCSIKRLRRDRR